MKYFSVAALIRYKGKYLFQKRDKKQGIFYPGFYSLFGGKGKIIERPINAIRRELYEETGIKFRSINHFLTLNMKSKFFNPKFASVFKRYIYVCEIDVKTKKKLKVYEGKGHIFLSLKKMHPNLIPFDYAIAKFHFFLNSKKKVIPIKYLK